MLLGQTGKGWSIQQFHYLGVCTLVRSFLRKELKMLLEWSPFLHLLPFQMFSATSTRLALSPLTPISLNYSSNYNSSHLFLPIIFIHTHNFHPRVRCIEITNFYRTQRPIMPPTLIWVTHKAGDSIKLQLSL